MHVINDLELMHGIAVLPRQQTAGTGRSGNQVSVLAATLTFNNTILFNDCLFLIYQWLSPMGCAMFSTQLHIAMDTPLGTRLSLIQHMIGAAIVNTLRGHKLYRVSDYV